MTFIYNSVLAFATILGQIGIVVLVIGMIYERATNQKVVLLTFVDRYALQLGLLFSGVATVGSLAYSDVLGYTPCNLCWYQRIFLYPQVILFILALLKKQRDVVYASLALSTGGALIAAFQYYGQMFDSSVLPCSAVGYSASCSQRFVAELGYITIPLMAFTAFGLLLATMAVRYSRQSK